MNKKSAFQHTLLVHAKALLDAGCTAYETSSSFSYVATFRAQLEDQDTVVEIRLNPDLARTHHLLLAVNATQSGRTVGKELRLWMLNMLHRQFNGRHVEGAISVTTASVTVTSDTFVIAAYRTLVALATEAAAVKLPKQEAPEPLKHILRVDDLDVECEATAEYKNGRWTLTLTTSVLLHQQLCELSDLVVVTLASDMPQNENGTLSFTLRD